MNSCRKYRRIVVNENGAARRESNKIAIAFTLLVSSAITIALLYFVTTHFKH